MRLYIKVLAAFLASLLGVIWGGWWAPLVVGLAFGAEDRRARVAVPASGAIGLVSWAVPLAVAQGRYGLGPTAQSLAAIMGFAHAPAVPLILTLLVGTLLGLTGAWLACAAWAVVAPIARVDALRNE